MLKRFLNTAILFSSYIQGTEPFSEDPATLEIVTIEAETVSEDPAALPKEEIVTIEVETVSEDPATLPKEEIVTIEAETVSEDPAALPKEEIAATEDVSTPGDAAVIEKINVPILEFRVSYFRPFSKTLRKLTGEGAVYGLEATVPVWRGWNVWGEVDYYSKSGTMEGIHRSVHITMIPITLGLKYFYYFNRYYGLYAGGGGKYYFVEEINRVFPMHKTTHRNGLGGVIEIGNVFCINHFLIDIFSSWSFKKIDGPNHLPLNATSFSMQVGGWNIGMGLGYKF